MMKVHTLYQPCYFKPQLYIVKTKPDEAAHAKLISAAWTFSYTALWNCMAFSEEEIYTAKQCISELFAPLKNKEKAFIIFCERVLLARNYLSRDKERFIPLPSLWLCRDNKNGFAGTKKWHEQMVITRRSVPSYKCNEALLAKAALEFCNQPMRTVYDKWKNHFISKGDHRFLILFQLYVLNYKPLYLP